MANLSYCRFENTLSDLRDVLDHMDDELSPSEQKARQRLIELCKRIAENYGDVEPARTPVKEAA